MDKKFDLQMKFYATLSYYAFIIFWCQITMKIQEKKMVKDRTCH